MNRLSAFLLRLSLAAAFVAMVAPDALAQTVQVTIRCNTSTCLDTLRPNHIVQLRGVSAKGIVPAITWDVGAPLTNVGGDYWQVTITAVPGDSIQYKFVTYFNASTPTFHWNGWEGDLVSGASWASNNRALVVGTTDTTLPLQYYNGWEPPLAQYWRPFAAKADTIAVYFRVNMGGVTFNPTTQIPLVYAGAPMGADPTWVQIVQLTREVNSVNGGSFWSGVAYVAKANVTADVTQQFKFVINSPLTWEQVGNRSFPFTATLRTGTEDTTLQWYYFDDLPPRGSPVTGTVTFRLKLQALEKANLFNRGLGDRVAVTGAKGWPPDPFDFATEPTMLKMTYAPSFQEWILQEPFTLFPQTPMSYKYYIRWDTSRVIEGNPNFIPALNLTDGWEEPGSTGGADRRYIFTGSAPQSVPGDFGAAQQYFNSLHPKGVLSQPITVTFKIDMAPAADIVTNPTNPLFRPGIDTAYIQFDGSFVPITQGKSMWGTDNRVMLEDLDGDGKYTGALLLSPPTFYQLCYRIAYTSASGEVWNGGGVQRGRRYYQYIFPTAVTADSARWPSSYDLKEMPWMAGNLTVEDPPNLDRITGIGDQDTGVPGTCVLYQNYPNPFNPSTVVTYAVPENSRVTIEVFSTLGQRIATLVDQVQPPGTHSVAWSAENGRGGRLGSGVYLLRMRAGGFSQVRKMLLTR